MINDCIWPIKPHLLCAQSGLAFGLNERQQGQRLDGFIEAAIWDTMCQQYALRPRLTL